MASPVAFFVALFVLFNFHVSADIVFEDGYTVSTILDGHKSKLYPHSILPQFGSSDFIVLDSVNSAFYTVSLTSSQEGEIEQLLGNGSGFSDGDLATAQFAKPKSFALDFNGNIYVADQNNYAIRKISKSGVTTIAGGGSRRGHKDGPGRNTSFSADFELAFVPARCALMICDRGHNLIRQINLKPQDCSRGSQSGLAAAPVWAWALCLGISCLIGLIIGFAVRPYIYPHESSKLYFNATWKHCLISQGRQVLMFCFDIRSAVASSRLYAFSRRFIMLSLSHLSLMYLSLMFRRGTLEPPQASCKKSVSLLDSEPLGSEAISESQIFAEQLKDLLTSEAEMELANPTVKTLEQEDENERSTQLSFQFEIDIQQQHHQAVYWMDNSLATMGSLSGSNDENPRVKFLCSFSGSILPRPQDGKLRYVGGETRIVSVPRDITYEELMAKMRELYEGATVLKYQQPDEDLDALVSVVNDDDVINMMEEYDKLGSGDGFTRLRIFLFAHPDQDASSHFVDGDERDTERRYVDALNSLNDSPEFWKQEGNESVVAGGLDDILAAEQYFSQISLEGGLHNQNIPQFNLRHLTIPHMGSGQLQQMEAPWSPAYYSPRHPGTHDPRASVEFPTSPSSARYRSSPYGEFSEKGLDRMSDEYSRQHVNHQSPLDNQPQFSDNVVWLSNGPIPGDKSGFPGNVLHGPNIFDGSSICEHCRMAFHRNQAYPDSPWKHGEHPHLEQPNVANGLHQVTSPSAECPPNRETFMLSTDAKYQHGFYPREPNDLRPLYNEAHNHERARIMQPQSNPRVDEPRSHIPGAGRLNDPYIVDGTSMHIPILPGNLADGNHVTSNFVHEDMRYIRPGPELRNEVFHDHTLASGSHIHVPPLDERGARYGYPYGADNIHQASHGPAPAPAHGLWRHVHNPLQVATPYEVSASPPQTNGVVSPGFIKGSLESSPRLSNGVESHNPWVESSQKMVGVDASIPGVSYGHALKLNPQTYAQENQCLVNAESVPSTIDMLSMTNPRDPVQLSDSVSALTSDRLASLTTLVPELRSDTHVTESVKMVEKCINQERKEANWVEKVGDSIVEDISVPDRNKNLGVASSGSINSNGLRPVEECCVIVKANENGTHAPLEDKALCDRLSFLPEIISSIKKETLEGVGEVKTKATDVDSIIEQDVTSKEETRNEPESADVHGDMELDSDNDNPKNSKIEPTKAEEEAIKMGLQTIKNDDLEEIKELGSGTYGAVYHGKWKGSDVAIKRIKASCFAGRPLERERLIADFWKEALILSSLHHPNVVSFYGIVRDGPDGSLATVTEFMINGSLKQFLQKKDRTIDRRKRLIIAMDAAFGMEYLHGKNIVHFDLKCENLLVNMRDPHRPVCKIGDLGLSKVKQHTLVSGGVRGTLPWMAPELLSGKSNMVTEKIDVYSFGIVMWELLTGDEPYADMHCASIIGGIVNNSLRPKIPTWCDPEWKLLMESCWASDPAGRPSFSDISQRLRNMAAAINVK